MHRPAHPGEAQGEVVGHALPCGLEEVVVGPVAEQHVECLRGGLVCVESIVCGRTVGNATVVTAEAQATGGA